MYYLEAINDKTGVKSFYHGIKNGRFIFRIAFCDDLKVFKQLAAAKRHQARINKTGVFTCTIVNTNK